LIAATTGALRAVAGQPARPGLIEVPRDEQGLPLVPGKIGEQPAPGTGSDDPEAGTLDGRPAPPSAPAGLAVEAASTKPQTATTPPAGQDGPSEPPAGTASSPDARHSAAAAGPRPVMAQPDVAAMLPPGVGTTVTAGSVAVSMPAASAPDALGRGTTPTVDPQQIQAQVARQILAREQAAGDGPGTLTLRLEPEHLGKVEVRLRASGGQLTVEFQAESAEAGAALREGRHELARALGAQAGRWQQVEVRVADPERPGAETEEHEEERSEHGSGRERDPDERRRERGER
jgi:flagellar hook-length control protein FliK